MYLYPKTLLAAAVILVAFSSVAQEAYHANDRGLLVRLSYDDSVVARQGMGSTYALLYLGMEIIE